jgi:hypothetical protein
MRRICEFSLYTILAAVSLTGAAALTYEKDVLPILEKHCVKCHNNDKMKGGVSVDIPDMKSDIGRIVMPGDPGDSMLLRVLVEQDIENKMPPKGGPLDVSDIQKIRKWIVEGAHFKGDPGATSGSAKVATSTLGKKPLSGDWTNKAGKAIKADLLKIEEGKAVLRLPNGRIYKYPIDELSTESAAKARAFAEGE